MSTNKISRRNFLQKTAVTTGVASLGTLGMANDSFLKREPEIKNHREVWIAGFSQMDVDEETSELMIERVLNMLKEVVPYKPDFVCLPEVFPFANVEKKTNVAERLEISKTVLEKFSEFSKVNNCYTICPVLTSDNGKSYNSAVVFNRKGEKIGVYNKIHLTEGEIAKGLSCGPLIQPAIQTEYGPIGVQICFDIEWDDGWTMLRDQGAEIIFWPSAFAGGIMVNTKAWQHKCVVVSSTNKNTSKLCDISGEVIASTGLWNKHLFCAPVNLEKVFLHLWPYVYRYKEIQRKYGRKVKITSYHEEEWTVIESLSTDVRVKDIIKEFELKTHEELMKGSEIVQIKERGAL